MVKKIQMRRGTAAEWTSVNPVLSQGESGFETDTGRFKIGDGTSTWSELDYAGDGTKISSNDTTTGYLNGKLVAGTNISVTENNDGADETLTIAVDGITSDVVGTTDTQTLSNKTLTSPVLNTGVSGTAVLDSDTMTGASNTTLATSESIKAYVDAQIADTLTSEMTYKGGYDASTNSPDLDSSPSGVKKGDVYTVTVAGTFFTVDVEAGDLIIAEISDAAAEADWTIVNKGLDAATIKTLYESNSDTNAFTDAEKTKVAGIEDGAKDDQSAAEVPFTVNGDITSTNVQNAIVEVRDDTDTKIGALTHDGFADFVANEHLPAINEDDMSSDSDAHVPTQQSVKAYVDASTEAITITSQAEQDALTSPVENKFVKITTACNLTKTYVNCVIASEGTNSDVTLTGAAQLRSCSFHGGNSCDFSINGSSVILDRTDILLDGRFYFVDLQEMEDCKIQCYSFYHQTVTEKILRQCEVYATIDLVLEGSAPLRIVAGNITLGRDILIKDTAGGGGGSKAMYATDSNISCRGLRCDATTNAYVNMASDTDTAPSKIHFSRIEDANLIGKTSLFNKGSISIDYMGVDTSIFDGVSHTSGEVDIKHYDGANVTPSIREVEVYSIQDDVPASDVTVENKHIIVQGLLTLSATYNNCKIEISDAISFDPVIITGVMHNCEIVGKWVSFKPNTDDSKYLYNCNILVDTFDIYWESFDARIDNCCITASTLNIETADTSSKYLVSSSITAQTLQVKAAVNSTIFIDSDFTASNWWDYCASTNYLLNFSGLTNIKNLILPLESDSSDIKCEVHGVLNLENVLFYADNITRKIQSYQTTTPSNIRQGTIHIGEVRRFPNDGTTPSQLIVDDTTYTTSAYYGVKHHVGEPRGDVIYINSQADQDALPDDVSNKTIYSTAAYNLTKNYYNCTFVQHMPWGPPYINLKIKADFHNCRVYNNYYVDIDDAAADVRNCTFNTASFRFYNLDIFLNNVLNASTISLHNTTALDVDKCNVSANLIQATASKTADFVFKASRVSTDNFENKDESGTSVSANYCTMNINEYICTAAAANGKLGTAYGELNIAKIIAENIDASKSNLIQASYVHALGRVGYFDVTTSIFNGIEHKAGETNVTHFEGKRQDVILLANSTEELALPDVIENKTVIISGSTNFTKTYKNCNFYKNTGTHVHKITTATLQDCNIYNDYYVDVQGDCVIRNCTFNATNFRIYEVTGSTNFQYNTINCANFRIHTNVATNFYRCNINAAELIYVDDSQTANLQLQYSTINTPNYTNHNSTTAADVVISSATLNIGEYRCDTGATGQLVNSAYGNINIGRIAKDSDGNIDTSVSNLIVSTYPNSILKVGHFPDTISIVNGNGHLAGETDVTYYGGVWQGSLNKADNWTSTTLTTPALDIDWTNGQYQYKTITSDSTFTFSNNQEGMQVTIAITADGTDRNITFPVSIRWEGGTSPTAVTADTTSLYSFVQINSFIYGSAIEGME